MSALRGKELADLTDQTLENMRNEHDLACYTKQYHQQQFQESEESPTIKYCITLQERQRQQWQALFGKSV